MNKNRFLRHTQIPEIGSQGQEKLQAAKVLVVGLGGLGVPVAQYLTAAGVGQVGLMDADTIQISNLPRQPLYANADLGHRKAVVLKSKLEQTQSPVSKIMALEQSLDSSNARSTFKNYHLIVDATDNFEAKYLINDTCVSLKIPFVHGAIEKFSGQVSVFNLNQSANFRDFLPENPNIYLSENCNATGILGPVAGVIGTLMALEAVKVITQVGELLINTILFYDFLNHTYRKFNITPQHIQPSSLSSRTPFLLKKKNLLKIDNLLLIDIREKHEHEAYNIGGINIPQNDFLKNKTYNDYLGKTIIVYCQSGKKAKAVVKYIQKHDPDRSSHVFALDDAID